MFSSTAPILRKEFPVAGKDFEQEGLAFTQKELLTARSLSSSRATISCA